MFFPANLMA